MDFHCSNLYDDSKIEKFIKTAKTNKISHFLRLLFKNEMQTIVNYVINKFKNIPLDTNDVYNLCLYHATMVAKNYSKNSNISFLKFVFSRVKLILCNELRYWIRKRRSYNLFMINNLNNDNLEIEFSDETSLKNISSKIDEIDTRKLFKKILDQKQVNKIKLLANNSKASLKKIYKSTNRINKERKMLAHKINVFYNFN